MELDSELMGMVVHLDEEFYPHFLTTIAGRRWIISCGFRLAVMKCLQSSKYVAALGTAIGLAIDKGIQTELVTGIDHGKARRGLAEVTAYDPFRVLLLKLHRSAGYSLRISNFYCPSTGMALLVDPLSSKNLGGELVPQEYQQPMPPLLLYPFQSLLLMLAPFHLYEWLIMKC
nr:hypothetical protein [Tanacetum cinerariifolium]